MRNTLLLRSIILFIAVSAIIYDFFFLIKIYQNPTGITGYGGYWAFPVAIVFIFLYAYLNKHRQG